ncbi:hypothetical protein F7725_004061 [Dissostichus mawsoni]|uniref:Endonuclease/exonuclease/phosphatase domain-containing protein n=1 Tax=Dissostichus mawsoni TaxID=36200 RepID=A0A7J5YCX5_DISMA|nr:hypothetical protein F7725_004061 [Dissostichus mawsoni]
MRLLCALGLFLALLHVTSCLRIGAFNIENFGPKKSKDVFVMNTIKEIVLRYDIILIQGLQDEELQVHQSLMDLVNKGTTEFSYIVSEPLPLGSSIFQFMSHKERYLFLYRNQKVSVKGSFQYTEKVFERPPFVNIMVLGDFNADGKYVKAVDRKKIRLLNNNDFHWLIADGVDTTVAKSSDTYDRIVVTTEMEMGVAKKVSDHFPVEVELKPESESDPEPEPEA